MLINSVLQCNLNPISLSAPASAVSLSSLKPRLPFLHFILPMLLEKCYKNIRIYQQPFSRLVKSTEMNPIFKALRKFCTTENLFNFCEKFLTAFKI